MQQLKQARIQCPHCGHAMHVEVDYSAGDQSYFEECPNCADSVHINLHIDEVHRKLDINVISDDEQLY